MKNRLYKSFLAACFCLLLAVCALNVSSCAEVGIDSQAELPLKLVTDAQPQYAVMASLPRSIVINVSSNTPWKIESDQNWCIPTPAISSASSLIAEVTVKIEKNETEQPRTAILTIKADNIDQQQKITIVQDAKGKLEVQPIEEMFGSDRESKMFTVCANQEWSITSSSTWLTLDKSTGPGDNVVTQILATASANSGARRTATITIKSGLEECKFDVTQNGIQLELPEISVEDATFSPLGETLSYPVAANVEWTAEVEDKTINWITLSKSEDNQSVIVKASYNTQFTNREARIRILPKNDIPGVEGALFTIYQKHDHSTLIASGNTITFDEKGAATVDMVKGEARFVTKTRHKLGKFTWKFSSFHISDKDSHFELNFWPNSGDSPGTSNYHVYLGLEKHEFSTGGGFDWANKPLTFTQTDLDNIRKMTVIVDHDPKNQGKLKLTLQLNDVEVAVIDNRSNPYTNPAELGAPIFFGFNNKCLTPASFVIESFEAIPYE